MLSRWIRLVTVAAALGAGAWSVAPARQVILAAAPGRIALPVQARIAGYAEDATYVSGGRFAGWIAMSVGSEVLGVPASALGSRKSLRPVKLFDYRAAGPRFRPTGLVYVPELDRFVANYSPSSANDGRFGPTDVYSVFDENGGVERWPLVFAEGMSTLGRPEGLAYIPTDAEGFSDALRGHLITVMDYDLVEVGIARRLDVIEIDATARVFRVVRQFPFTSDAGYFGDVAVLPSGRLVLIAYGDPRLFDLDLGLDPDTATLTPLESFGTTSGGEALVALPDGRLVAVTAYPSSLVPITESGGAWSAAAAIPFSFGLGRDVFGGLAWDAARGRFLVAERRGSMLETESQVVAIPQTLTSATLVRTMWTEPSLDYRDRLLYGLTYDAGRDAAVVARSGRRLEDFRAGEQAFAVPPAIVTGSLQHPTRPPTYADITAAVGAFTSGFTYPRYVATSSNGPAAIAHMADLSRYAVLMRRGDWQTLYFVDEDGSAVQDEGGGPASVAVSVTCPEGMHFSASQLAALSPAADGVRYAVVGECRAPVPATASDWGPPLVVLLDETGTEVARVDPFEALGMVRPGSVTFVTTGKYAGALALVNDDTLAVFRMR